MRCIIENRQNTKLSRYLLATTIHVRTYNRERKREVKCGKCGVGSIIETGHHRSDRNRGGGQ